MTKICKARCFTFLDYS